MKWLYCDVVGWESGGWGTAGVRNGCRGRWLASKDGGGNSVEWQFWGRNCTLITLHSQVVGIWRKELLGWEAGGLGGFLQREGTIGGRERGGEEGGW